MITRSGSVGDWVIEVQRLFKCVRCGSTRAIRASRKTKLIYEEEYVSLDASHTQRIVSHRCMLTFGSSGRGGNFNAANTTSIPVAKRKHNSSAYVV